MVDALIRETIAALPLARAVSFQASEPAVHSKLASRLLELCAVGALSSNAVQQLAEAAVLGVTANFVPGRTSKYLRAIEPTLDHPMARHARPGCR